MHIPAGGTPGVRQFAVGGILGAWGGHTPPTKPPLIVHLGNIEKNPAWHLLSPPPSGCFFLSAAMSSQSINNHLNQCMWLARQVARG